jgi:GNAT superfamily N-acetyltransferase
MKTISTTWNFPINGHLCAHVTIDGDAPLLEQFYRGFDRCFILDSEKETLEGFRACLNQNASPVYEALQARYGDFMELLMLVTKTDSPEAIGGANWICFPGLQGELSINLNYIYVLPEYRGHGYFKTLIAACESISASMLARAGSRAVQTLIFTEHNHPWRMSMADQQIDSAHTALDQVDRMKIWATVGSRLIDFPYVQPPLSDEQEPMDSLVYAVKGAEGDTLDPLVLKHHLERFFGISVLKGQPLEESPTAQAQLERLSDMARAGEVIPLLTLPTWMHQFTEVTGSEISGQEQPA